jgi:hypothetical protein
MILALAMVLAQDGVIERFKEKHAEFLKDQYRLEHAFQLGWLTQPDTEIDDINGEVDLDILWAQGSVPLPVTEDAYGFVGFRVESRRYERSATFGLLDEDETFTVAYLVLGGAGFVAPDLQLGAYAGFGIASDLDESLESDDYRIRGRMLATGRIDSRLFWKVGFDISEQDDGARVVPLIGGAIVFNEKLRLDALLPKWLLLTWEAAERFYLAVGWDLTGEEYHRFSAADVEGELRVDDYRFYVEARYHVVEKAGVWARFGVSTGPVELETDAGSVDEWQELQVFFEVGVSFDLF